MVSDDMLFEAISQYPGKKLGDLRELIDVCAPERVVDVSLQRMRNSGRIYYKRGVGWYPADESTE